MATSSIFHNFTITDEKAAEQFLDALDKASAAPAWEPKYKGPLVRDPEKIKAMANRALAMKRAKCNGL